MRRGGSTGARPGTASARARTGSRSASSWWARPASPLDIRSGRTGNVLRTITSTTAGENLGFDAVGLGDVDRDHRPDLLLSAAEGDTVYLVAGS
jgi:hypothetical protein